MFKKMADKAPTQASVDLAEERMAKIRERAHELYEARGREEGHDLEDWLKAEIDTEEPTTSESKG